MRSAKTTRARQRRPARSVTPAPPVHPFDRQFGTETGGLIPRAGLVTGSASDAHVTAYYAVAPSILDGLVDHWLGSGPALAIDRYTFLDVGAGKGRATMLAARHPFLAVAGVELNPALAAIAAANLERFGAHPEAQMLAPASVVVGDALEVPLPGTATVAFLFHPFEAPLLRQFMARLEAHFRSLARPLDLLYVNAEHADVLDRNPAWRQIYRGLVPMTALDHLADLAEIAGQKEYGSTGDEVCGIWRLLPVDA